MAILYLAANRFGLGRRQDEPAVADPKAWLTRQLGDYNPAPPAFAALAGRDAIAAGLLWGNALGAKGPDGMAPIGPAWKDVSAKYKGDKKAADTLTQTVLKGSNPYESHWKGKASGLAMPPNAVAIKEADARQLVQWILGLQPR